MALNCPPAIPLNRPLIQAAFLKRGVIGSARLDLVGGAHPIVASGLLHRGENEKILALARSPEGAFLVYAGSDSCEGQIWINAAPRVHLTGRTSLPLPTLPIIQPKADAIPRMRLVDTEAICSAAGSAGDGHRSAPPCRSIPRMGLPAEVQATVTDDIDAIICHEYSTTPIENCHRLGPG